MSRYSYFLTMEEKSIFVDYFGDYPLIRVLDSLILARDMDHSMTEIAKNAEVGWTAFSEIWPQLLKKELVIFTRKIGNAKLFRLNTRNPWVKELVRMDKIMTKFETEKILFKKEILA